MQTKKILVTGVAGFIGNAIARELLSFGHQVLGLDNLNDYYDVRLKKARLEQIENEKNFQFKKIDLANRKDLEECFQEFKPQQVMHLAAQAGVRYSLENPYAYIDSNIYAFMNILENCRHFLIEHLIYASSSSVYGANTKTPFAESDFVDQPVSLYAATKKSNELMAYSYSHLYKIPMTGLRFFTVYGPWGRPDMAYYKFAKSILNEEPVEIYGDGQAERDFTYIADIVSALTKFIRHLPKPDQRGAPFALYNLGNDKPEKILKMVSILEELLGKKARVKFLPPAPGDVKQTHADLTKIKQAIEYQPQTSLQKGLESFVKWVKAYRAR